MLSPFYLFSSFMKIYPFWSFFFHFIELVWHTYMRKCAFLKDLFQSEVNKLIQSIPQKRDERLALLDKMT